jgi:hypothetical protein
VYTGLLIYLEISSWTLKRDEWGVVYEAVDGNLVTETQVRMMQHGDQQVCAFVGMNWKFGCNT